MSNPLKAFFDTPKGRAKAITDWARHIGISRSLIYKLMQGTRLPSLATAFKIEDATEGVVSVQAWREVVKNGGQV